MIWRVEIKQKAGVFDAAGAGIQKDIVDLGVNSVHKVEVIQIYNIEGSISEEQVTRVCRELFVDGITQEYACCKSNEWRAADLEAAGDCKAIEIARNPGVMDPVEESALKGVRDLGIGQVQAVRRARRYLLYGNIPAQDLEIITNKVLSNKLIQHAVTDPSKQKTFLLSKPQETFELVQVDLLGADDKKLKAISQGGQLFLNLNEMKAIQAHFKKSGRNPTDCELETIAQTWSEHCYHKTFRGNIEYSFKENGKQKKTIIKSLLKSTIVKATQEINKSWCVSVFHDKAGVIEFDNTHHVCFKVETHNHP